MNGKRVGNNKQVGQSLFAAFNPIDQRGLKTIPLLNLASGTQLMVAARGPYSRSSLLGHWDL